MEIVYVLLDIEAAVVVWVSMIVALYLSSRRTGQTECSCLNHRVPVHIPTGEHVADLCIRCGKHVYMVSWVFRGE